MYDDKYMANLLWRHFSQETTPLEEDIIKKWLEASEENRSTYKLFNDPEWLRGELKWLGNVDLQASRKKLQEKIQMLPTEVIDAEGIHSDGIHIYRNKPLRKIAAVLRAFIANITWVKGAFGVVALLVVIGVSIRVLYVKPNQPGATVQDTHKVILDSTTKETQPKILTKGQALLEINGYPAIRLDQAINSILFKTGNLQIIKENGIIKYKRIGVDSSEKPVFSRLRTGPQCQYRILLADASVVRLNAKSSLAFVNNIPGREREVQVDGEAYFNVAHMPSHPFHVIVGGANLEVLGTRFNVQSSAEDSVITTSLVKGSIRIRSGRFEKLLLPGQIARIMPDKPIMVKSDNAAINKTLQWTEQRFNFKGENLAEIMRVLQQWYGFNLNMPDVPDKKIEAGPFPYDLGLPTILQCLEDPCKVRFQIDNNNNVIVLPNKILGETK